MLMIKMIPYFFLATLVGGMVFLWQQIPLPCEKPIEYTLGIIDPRFNVSEADFLETVMAAELPWEEIVGKELFHYNPQATFTVNLLFDERQERTQKQQELVASLAETQSTQETLDEKQARVLALYEEKRSDYERMVSVFKRQLDAYNADVKKWNALGGAPKDEYEKLERTARSLEKNQGELERERTDLNILVTRVNAFSDQKVALVSDYNERLNDYVDRYGEPGEFDQGEYVDQEINIYQYDDILHLRAVLVHEFGHAIGLTHGTNPTSVMYHLMKEQSLDPLILTAEDRALINAECHRGAWSMMRDRFSALKLTVWSQMESWIIRMQEISF